MLASTSCSLGLVPDPRTIRGTKEDVKGKEATLGLERGGIPLWGRDAHRP